MDERSLMATVRVSEATGATRAGDTTIVTGGGGSSGDGSSGGGEEGGRTTASTSVGALGVVVTVLPMKVPLAAAAAISVLMPVTAAWAVVSVVVWMVAVTVMEPAAMESETAKGPTPVAAATLAV